MRICGTGAHSQQNPEVGLEQGDAKNLKLLNVTAGPAVSLSVLLYYNIATYELLYSTSPEISGKPSSHRSPPPDDGREAPSDP